MISSLLHLVGLRPRVYYTLTNFRGGGKAPLPPSIRQWYILLTYFWGVEIFQERLRFFREGFRIFRIGMRYFQGVGLRILQWGLRSFRGGGVEIFWGGVEIFSRALRKWCMVEKFQEG